MNNIEALQVIELGQTPDQGVLARLHEAKLIEVADVTHMQSPTREFIFSRFTPEGLRLLKKSKASLVSDREKEITHCVVRHFLDEHEATSTRQLLRKFKSAITTELQRLTNRGVLQKSNNAQPNETYLPTAVAFHHCGDSEALTFARKSTETVLRVLRILFDRELEGEGNEQRQFTAKEVEDEARTIEPDIEPSAIFIGLYLAQEFMVFTGFRRDDRQIGILSFSLGERVYETQYLDWDKRIRQSNVGLIYDQNPELASESFSSLHLPDPALSEGDSDNRKIFLVHGHAEKPKKVVADVLRSAGLDVVILHEQPNEGKTIIEKFEKHSDVGFAVVLLKPDDVGASALHPEDSQRRARQNVILELGYFMGKLGRGKVCCLYVEGVELPSDYQGVLWLPYDDRRDWTHQLTKELVAAGIAVNVNAG